jgi:hypothetical protein
MSPTSESAEAAALREQCLKLLGQAIADWRVATPAWAEAVRRLVHRYNEVSSRQPMPATDEIPSSARTNRAQELEASHRARDAAEAGRPSTGLAHDLTHEGLISALKNREQELDGSDRAEDAAEAKRLHAVLAEDLLDLAQNSDPAGLGKVASDRQTAIAFLERTGRGD